MKLRQVLSATASTLELAATGTALALHHAAFLLRELGGSDDDDFTSRDGEEARRAEGARAPLHELVRRRSVGLENRASELKRTGTDR